jgi:hypothetical protein
MNDQDNTRPTRNPRTISQYDSRTGWTKVPDPGAHADNWDKVVREAGFVIFWEIGEESGARAVVWSHPDGRFLVELDGPLIWHAIQAVDWPALFDLLAKIAPVMEAASLAKLNEKLDDLTELLTESHGPLYEAQQAKWLREIEKREQAKGERRP